MLDRKVLKQETGFLNHHLSMTFEVRVPYVKGFYLTLNSWRQGRDAENWKVVSDKQWRQILLQRYYDGKITSAKLARLKCVDAFGNGSPGAI